MREYILLLPILFIFHDMEEIAGFIWFFKRNTYLFDRFPKVMNTYRGMTHTGFALAVYEEFIPFFGVSLLAYYFRMMFSMVFGLAYLCLWQAISSSISVIRYTSENTYPVS